jgi:hypothetical protein
MKQIFFAAIAALAIVAPPARAEVSMLTTIGDMQVRWDGQIWLRLDTVPAGAPNCDAGVPFQYFKMVLGQQSMTDLGMRTLLQLFLLQETLDVPLTVFFDETTTNCAIKRLMLSFE